MKNFYENRGVTVSTLLLLSFFIVIFVEFAYVNVPQSFIPRSQAQSYNSTPSVDNDTFKVYLPVVQIQLKSSSISIEFGPFAIDQSLRNSILTTLSMRPDSLISGNRFVVTSERAEGTWRLLSLASLDGSLCITEHHIGGGECGSLVIASYEQNYGWQTAIAGTVEFSRLSSLAVGTFLSEEAKHNLDPLSPSAANTENFEFKFPWVSHLSWEYRLGWHPPYPPTPVPATPVGSWVGVDIGTRGENADLRILATERGTITHICRRQQSTDRSASITINHGGTRLQYIHLNVDTLLPGIAEGIDVERGQVLGWLLTGDIDDSCGNADQVADSAHIHLSLPTGNSFTIDGWTTRYPNTAWSKNQEIIVPTFPYQTFTSSNVMYNGSQTLGNIVGLVKDEVGTPLSAKQVTLFTGNNTVSTLSISAFTDQNGTYTFTGVPSGPSRIVASAYGKQEGIDFVVHPYAITQAPDIVIVSQCVASSGTHKAISECTTPTPNPGASTPTPTPIPSANIEIININSPSTVNPNQSFIPEVTVRLLNGQQLLESRGDMLRHYSGTNYSTFPHIGVVGSVISGQTYTFRFYDGYPFVAPSSNGTYESIWRVWANGQWLGPEIPIRFTVGSQSTPTPDWLLSHAESCEIPRVQCSLDANISNIAKRAFRIRINDWTCGEISGSATYLWCRWDAVNYPNGNYSIHYELDPPGSEGAPWSNPLRYTHNFELGGSAEGLALCDGGNGLYIRQGDRCVRLTQSNRDIAPLSFSGQNVEFSVTGAYQAWLYNAGDFKGTIWVVTPGAGRTLSYVNSVKLIDNPDVPPPLPADPYACDPNTVLLFHFDEASGLPTNACPPSGAATGNTAVSTAGKWGSALRYDNSASQKTDLGSYNPCALTVDFWYRRLDSGGIHILARQDNKWELSTDGNRVILEVWGKYGSEKAYGWKEINDSNWHYIMFTYDCANTNSLSKLYIDNELVGEVVTNEQWHLNTAPILLDGRNGQHAIHGEIDEFRVSYSVRSINDLGPIQSPATPTPQPTSTPTPLPTATFTPTPIPGVYALINGVIASGNGAIPMQSASYQMLGSIGEPGLPNNVTTLSSTNFQYQPGFLAAAPSSWTVAAYMDLSTTGEGSTGENNNTVILDEKLFLPLINR